MTWTAMRPPTVSAARLLLNDLCPPLGGRGRRTTGVVACLLLPLPMPTLVPRLGIPTPAAAVLPILLVNVGVGTEVDPAGTRPAAAAGWLCGHRPTEPFSSDLQRLTKCLLLHEVVDEDESVLAIGWPLTGRCKGKFARKLVSSSLRLITT